MNFDFFRKFNLFLDKKFAQNELSKRIIHGTKWGSTGGIITRFFTIIFSFLLARTLGSDGLGQYSIINSTSSTIAGLAGLGLGATISRYSAILKVADPQRLGRIIGLTFSIGWVSALVYGIAYFFITSWLATEIYNAPHLETLLKVSSFAFIFSLINSIQTSSLNGLESFKLTSILTTATTILQTLLVLIFSYFFGLEGAVITASISAILIFILFYHYSRKEYKTKGIQISFRNLGSELKVIWEYSLPAFFSSLITGPVVWLTNSMLVNQENGFSELGVFSIAAQWDNAVRFLPMYIASSAIPVITDLTINKSFQEGFKLTLKLMKTVFFISLPIALGIVAFTPIIMKGYGTTFQGGELTVIITVLTTVLILTSNQVGSFISATGKMWFGFILNLIWGLLFLIFAHFMVNKGAVGLATSKLLAYTMHFILSLVLCVYFVRYNKNLVG